MPAPRPDPQLDPPAPGATTKHDHAWAAGAQAGSEQAFEALFTAYYSSLSTFAYRYVLSRDVAEELVQEVFLCVWEHASHWETEDATRAYLFTAVRNAAISYLRHEKVVRRSEAASVEFICQSHPTADGDLRMAELTLVLQRAIARLPERCRLVFTLSREERMTYNEIAGVLRISPKTVEVQMGRAYKVLRRVLAGYWP